jgi:pimeloyl-ACP methyl ester carboxylesterase
MNMPNGYEHMNHGRRRFLSTAAVTMAVAQFGVFQSANAQSGDTKPARASSTGKTANGSFDTLKQIDAGVLNVGFAEAGPADGFVIILPHGWPYDFHSFVEVVPFLTAAGYRVIIPHLRGYDATRFLLAGSCGLGIFCCRCFASKIVENNQN